MTNVRWIIPRTRPQREPEGSMLIFFDELRRKVPLGK